MPTLGVLWGTSGVVSSSRAEMETGGLRDGARGGTRGLGELNPLPMFYWAVLAGLGCARSFWPVLYWFALGCTVSYWAVMGYTGLHWAEPPCIVSYGIVLCHTGLYCSGHTVPGCTGLNRVVVGCTWPHRIRSALLVLYWASPWRGTPKQASPKWLPQGW